jgi:hypothetical protein
MLYCYWMRARTTRVRALRACMRTSPTTHAAHSAGLSQNYPNYPISPLREIKSAILLDDLHITHFLSATSYAQTTRIRSTRGALCATTNASNDSLYLLSSLPPVALFIHLSLRSVLQGREGPSSHGTEDSADWKAANFRAVRSIRKR